MKSMMGFVFFLLFLAGFALVMLQGRQMSQLGGSGAEVTGISWRPVKIGAESIPEDSGIYILFEVDGSISGHGGCNRFSGSLAQSDSGIAVGQLASTRMACSDEIMNREIAFMEAVQQTADFSSDGNRMSLLDSEGNALAAFVPGGGD
ncbi:MAG: META domain-containing protein [Woeseiaceae bacterium]